MRTLLLSFVLVLALAMIPCVLDGGDIQTDGKFISTDSTNPPMSVSSTALVSNLNAELLNGYESGDFVKFTDSATDSNLLDGYDTATSFSAKSQIYVSGGDGKLPEDVVDSTSIEDMTRRIFITAQEIQVACSSNPTTPTYFGSNPVLIFPADDSAHDIFVSAQIPEDWDGTSDFSIRLYWTNALIGGEVEWQGMYSALIPGEGVSVGPSLPSNVSSAGPAGDLIRTDPWTIPGGDLEPRDVLSIRVWRDSSSASDTNSDSAALIGIEYSYTAKR